MNTTRKMMCGAVLIFKSGTDQKKARRALRQIQHLLEQPARVEVYHPSQGGPVWYIP